MIEKVIDQVVTGDLAALSSLFSKIGSLVRVQRQRTTEGKEIAFPVVFTAAGIQCEPGNYIDLSPNSKERGILYFQLLSNPTSSDIGHGVFQLEAVLRLVAWFNVVQLNPSDPLLLAANVIKTINVKQPGIGTPAYLSNIVMQFDGFEQKDARIFQGFTYDESRSQFLMYPYDYFSIRYRAQATFKPSCVPAVTHSENECS